MTLRQYLAVHDDAAYLLSGSFRDPAVEAAARALRPVVDEAARLVYEFLSAYESSEEYTQERRAALSDGD